MRCNKCGKEIAEDSKSCVPCGSDDLKKESLKEKSIKNIINKIISHKFIISAIVVLISITVIITAVILADKKDNEIVKEEKIEENNLTEENMEKDTEEKNIEPDINLVKENFKLSYNSLLEQISSYNISNASSYSTSLFNTYRVLQSPTNGYIFAVYNKTNGKIEYTQNYGKGVGTEIIWVNYEADSPMAKYEGHYGEKTTEAFVVMALTNYSGKPTYVVDNRKNETFSTMSKYMKGRLEENSNYESQELKDYEIIKYRWIKDDEKLKINIEMKTNKNKIENILENEENNNSNVEELSKEETTEQKNKEKLKENDYSNYIEYSEEDNNYNEESDNNKYYEISEEEILKNREEENKEKSKKDIDRRLVKVWIKYTTKEESGYYISEGYDLSNDNDIAKINELSKEYKIRAFEFVCYGGDSATDAQVHFTIKIKETGESYDSSYTQSDIPLKSGTNTIIAEFSNKYGYSRKINAIINVND